MTGQGGSPDEIVAAAQAAIDRAVLRGNLQDDPLGLALEGVSAGVAAMGSLVKLLDTPTIAAEVTRLVAASIETTIPRAVNRSVPSVLPAINRRTAVLAGAAGAGLVAAGIGIGFALCWMLAAGPFDPRRAAGDAWDQLLAANPDPRPALAQATLRTDRDGRPYWQGVALWAGAEKPPAAAAR